MNMTRYKLTGLLAALLLLAGCSQEEETLPNQRNSIVSFLTSTHAPQLISEEAVAESPDENPPFYTAKGNTVYRYISNYYDSGRASRAEVKSGSRVSITFRAYVFSMRNITDSDMPFFTNDPDLEQALRTLPGQVRRFCLGYGLFLFAANGLEAGIYLCSWQIAGGGIRFLHVGAALLFSMQSAALSVLLEWRHPIRGWKTESDLWHHPRKYLVPLAMLLWIFLL